MEEVAYREPTAKDIGKIVEVSDYPEGHPNCDWHERRLIDVRKLPTRNIFKCGSILRTPKQAIENNEWVFFEYARIKVDE